MKASVKKTRLKITAMVLTKNEEKCLPRLLASLDWVDEIVVVDNQSTDQTVKIARSYKAKIISRVLHDFSSQWNSGLACATGDWVMIFDADEEVPKESVPALQSAFQHAAANIGGFRVLRRNYALGQWLRYGQQYGKKVQWYDLVRIRRGYKVGDYIGGAVKLFRRAGAKFENLVHEEVKVTGTVHQLQAYVNHYTADSVHDMFEKVFFYTSLHARQNYEQNPQPPKGFYTMILWSPIRTFLNCYVRKMGYRDGFPGLARCLANMLYEFLKNIKIYDYYWGQKIS